MAKMRDERGLPRENTAAKKQRGGRPSGNVPGDMKIVAPISPRGNRSAAHYADAMKPLGGSDAGVHSYSADSGSH